MAVTGVTMVNEASKYLGENGKRFWAAYGVSTGTAWCCIFQWYLFKQMGISKLFYDGKKTAYVPTIRAWLQVNCKHVKMTEAEPGDLVIFTWNGKGNNKGTGNDSHIGMIRKKGTSKIAYTIEGNTNGGVVANRTRELKYIQGIYRPNYINVEKDKAHEWKLKYEVTKKLDIYKKTSSKSKKLGTIPKGTLVTTTYKKGTWYKLKYKDVTGWVEGAYLERVVYYTVVKGDTLTGIARKHGTTLAKLKKLNSIKNANLIFPGQKIRVR